MNEVSNTFNLTEKQKERMRKVIMKRWRNNESIIQLPSYNKENNNNKENNAQ